jgi:hypothetical protein
MEKERKIAAPEGCEIEKVEIVDGEAVVTFREKERKLPKSWDEFCDMFPIKNTECYIDSSSKICQTGYYNRLATTENSLPDRDTAEAVLALCQLIQLRNAYNGEWVPNYNDYTQKKYVIVFDENELLAVSTNSCASRLLIFKTKELRDEFLRNFRPLIEKLKPLYGVMEGGEE